MKNQDTGNIGELDITKLKSLINNGLKEIDKKFAQSVLVVGNTGTGKSTLINGLIGEKLQAVEDRGEVKIALVSQHGAKIGSTSVSETTVPQAWTDNRTGITYWDCPGFEDTKSIEQDIANGIFINKVFENSTQVKVLVVMSETQLKSDRGIDILKMAQRVATFFKDMDAISNSMVLVGTKIDNPKKFGPAIIQKKFSSLVSDHESNKESTALEQKGVKSFFNILSQPGKISIFPAPEKEGQSIVVDEAITDTLLAGISYTQIKEIGMLVSYQSMNAVHGFSKQAREDAIQASKELQGNIHQYLAQHGGKDAKEALPPLVKVRELVDKVLCLKQEVDQGSIKQYSAAMSELCEMVNCSNQFECIIESVNFCNKTLNAKEKLSEFALRDFDQVQKTVQKATQDIVDSVTQKYEKSFVYAQKTAIEYAKTPAVLQKKSLAQEIAQDVKAICEIPDPHSALDRFINFATKHNIVEQSIIEQMHNTLNEIKEVTSKVPNELQIGYATFNSQNVVMAARFNEVVDSIEKKELADAADATAKKLAQAQEAKAAAEELAREKEAQLAKVSESISQMNQDMSKMKQDTAEERALFKAEQEKLQKRLDDQAAEMALAKAAEEDRKKREDDEKKAAKEKADAEQLKLQQDMKQQFEAAEKQKKIEKLLEDMDPIDSTKSANSGDGNVFKITGNKISVKDCTSAISKFASKFDNDTYAHLNKGVYCVILSPEKVMFNSDLKFHGNLVVIAKTIEFSSCTIDLSGIDGSSGTNGRSKGDSDWNDKHNSNNHGDSGSSGSSGMPGGNVYMHAKEYKNIDNVSFKLNGGNGGNGGHGGSGAGCNKSYWTSPDNKDGGHGGSGGNAGHGGVGGQVRLYKVSKGKYEELALDKVKFEHGIGKDGTPGTGGSGGVAWSGGMFTSSGTNGSSGSNGVFASENLYASTVTTYCNKGFTNDYNELLGELVEAGFDNFML